ncbi:signal peptidase I [Bacillus sp. BRMEA1]|uniref:signal peptidase I n=1 Tax=Neobacillus endophyticus TaxID=2738405 RepID=UPI001563D316|nr:signal peptidase I [Neobacillus endophyticus]NRD78105.1 signal peptidase I [Neobacillus endophyticus]
MVENRSEIWEWVKALFIALILAFIVRCFFSPATVLGASMEPTLKDHDHMIVSKIGEPKRFDIIVFHATKNEDYIKRVIGLPGDHIEYKNDILYINGKPYEEPYLDKYKKEKKDNGPLTYSFTLKDTAVGSDVVPKGHLFVMGDNRRISKDSRVIGAIPIEKVIGTTNIVFYPIKEIKIVGK